MKMDGVAKFRRSTFSVPTSQDNAAESAPGRGANSSSGLEGKAPYFAARRSTFATSGAAAARDALHMPLSLSSSHAQKSSSMKRGGGLVIPKRVASQRSKPTASAARTGYMNQVYDKPYFSGALTSSNTAAALPVPSSQGSQQNRALLYERTAAPAPLDQRQFLSAEDFGGLGAGAATPPDSGVATPTSSSASAPSTDDLLDVRAMQLFENTQEGDAALPDDEWVARCADRGFVRVHTSDGSYSGAERCTMETSAGELADSIGSKWLFVCDSSGSVRRLAGNDKPLLLQTSKLQEMGYEGRRLQEYGMCVDVGHCIRFYDGKPVINTREEQVYVPSLLFIKQRSWYSMWRRRYCVICGNRLFLYSNETGKGRPSKVEILTGARVVEFRDKKREHCLCLLLQQEEGAPVRSYLISFNTWSEHEQWTRLIPKLSKQKPKEVDLSGCSLEALPDILLHDDNISILNLTRNYIQSRPVHPQNMHEQPATMRSLRAMKDVKRPFLHSQVESSLPKSGWLDDLLRFRNLYSLTLADNHLHNLPVVLYSITSLRELNVAVNQIEEIPKGIASLAHLQVLHLHSNRLSNLPMDVVQLQHLATLSIGFNRLKEIPLVIHQLKSLKRLMVAGNPVGPSIWSQLGQIGNLEALDARLIPVMESAQDAMLTTKLTYIDLDNMGIKSLNLPPAGSIKSMNCCHNQLTSLPMFYSSLTSVLANCNRIRELRMHPKPNNLTRLLLSRNCLKELPEEICDLGKLQVLDISHNDLTRLPARMFWNMPSLKGIDASFNQLQALPERIDNCRLERLHLQNNQLAELPVAFLMRATLLKVLTLSSNRLTRLPPIGPAHEIYHLEELALTNNRLNEQCFSTIAGFKKLKILHVAMNQLRQLPVKCIQELQELQELVVSRNQLTQLPMSSLAKLPRLGRLMAHSNQISEIGDLRRVTTLTRLDLSCNELTTIEHAGNVLRNLHGLDLSANPNLNITSGLASAFKGMPRVVVEEISNAEDHLASVGRHVDFHGLPLHGLWTHGSAEASGNRPRHCAAQVKEQSFRNGRDGLYAVFNGGQNAQIPNQLHLTMAGIVMEEFTRQQETGSGSKPLDYLKYAFLTAHSRLGALSRKGGASLALVHIYSPSSSSSAAAAARRSGIPNYRLHVANAGHVQIVVSREGTAVTLTKLHTTEDSKEERSRVARTGGFITPEGRVNGLLSATRVIGAAFLNPYVIPDPFLHSIELGGNDELLIIACAGLWLHVSHEEAVKVARCCTSPSQAAKSLRDLAQAYGSQGIISIVVVFFNQVMLSGRGRSTSGGSFSDMT